MRIESKKARPLTGEAGERYGDVFNQREAAMKIKTRHFAGWVVLGFAALPLFAVRASDDPPADATTKISTDARAAGEAVKRDARVVAKAAKEGAHKVAGAAKEIAHKVADASKEGAHKVAEASKEGAHKVAAAAKHGAERTKAAVKPDKPVESNDEKPPH